MQLASATDSLSLRVSAEQIAASAQGKNGRPPAIADADKVQQLLAALIDGNYRDVACRVAGIPKQAFYNALKRADEGDDAAIAFRDAVENAEAQAESGIVAKWRGAINAGPQYWAAAATFLERKSPDRWGRRQDESNTPKVVVQIGASSSDVTVNVAAIGGESVTTLPSGMPSNPTQIDVTPVESTSQYDVSNVTQRTLSDTDTPRLKVGKAQRAGTGRKAPGVRRGK